LGKHSHTYQTSRLCAEAQAATRLRPPPQRQRRKGQRQWWVGATAIGECTAAHRHVQKTWREAETARAAPSHSAPNSKARQTLWPAQGSGAGGGRCAPECTLPIGRLATSCREEQKQATHIPSSGCFHGRFLWRTRSTKRLIKSAAVSCTPHTTDMYPPCAIR
jgi:hypothetical protein